MPSGVSPVWNKFPYENVGSCVMNENERFREFKSSGCFICFREIGPVISLT
jgi:hypothetical protein